MFEGLQAPGSIATTRAHECGDGARYASPLLRDDAGTALDRIFLLLGSMSAFVSVAAGAFGAHALKARLSADLLAVFETAARYQLSHALALFGVAWACARWPLAAIRWSGWCFVAGTGLFCGSLYVLALTGQRGLGAVAPFGGAAFLLGWALLAWGAWRAGR
jgi:uncharacterized membrane protein YgdD (TMEM256/DUF423 family)